MRNISRWGKLHPWQARTLIVLIKLTLILIAWYIADTLLDLGVMLPSSVGYAALGIAIAACIVYPSKHLPNTSRLLRYRWQKSCDFVLGASCFLMVLIFFNNNFPFQNHRLQASHTTLPPGKKEKPSAQAIIESLKHRDSKSLTRIEKRILKKEIKPQVKLYLKAKLEGDKNKAAKIAGTILTILAAIGLLALLSALACEISCAGSEVLAFIVFIVGAAAIIYGAWWLIKQMNGPKRVREPSVNALSQ